jgi:hypothetical protein
MKLRQRRGEDFAQRHIAHKWLMQLDLHTTVLLGSVPCLSIGKSFRKFPQDDWPLSIKYQFGS